MIKAVIFDIDGVLVDSLDTNLQFCRALLKQAGYKKLPTKKDYAKMFHLPAIDVFRLFLGINDQRELQRLMKLVNAFPISRMLIKIIPGSVKVLRQLAKNYKLALVTSRVKNGVDHYLDSSKTRNLFSSAVYYGQYEKAKPSPEPLLLACKKLRIKPSEAIYVGDQWSDIQAAQAAKMKIILYPKKRLPAADAYIKDFSAIPQAVKNINSAIINI